MEYYNVTFVYKVKDLNKSFLDFLNNFYHNFYRRIPKWLSKIIPIFLKNISLRKKLIWDMNL